MNSLSRLSLFLLVTTILLTQGCTQRSPSMDPALDKKAGRVINNIRQTNEDIVTAKGTGWIKMRTGHDTERYKIVWAAAFPNKVRISFLMTHQPVETIVADGKKVTAVSHTGSHQPVTSNSRDPNMDRFIQIPVKMSDLIKLLLGRIPIFQNDMVFFSPEDPSFKTVIVKKQWGTSRQTISLNDDELPVEWITTGVEQRPMYQVIITSYKRFGSNTIPASVRLFDGREREITLTITRFDANPVIKPSVFRLTAN